MSLLLGWLPGKSAVCFRKGTITLRACPSCFARTVPIHFRLTPPSRFNLIWWDWLNKPQVHWFHRTEMVSQPTNGSSLDLTKLDEQTPSIIGLIKIHVVYTQKNMAHDSGVNLTSQEDWIVRLGACEGLAAFGTKARASWSTRVFDCLKYHCWKNSKVHQLMLVVYPIIGLFDIPGGCFGFLNHQWQKNTFQSEIVLKVASLKHCFRVRTIFWLLSSVFCSGLCKE